jgi:hypothetical protein
MQTAMDPMATGMVAPLGEAKIEGKGETPGGPKKFYK